MSSNRLLLVHSPLVGPSTMSPLADELVRRGVAAWCPDLRGAGSWSELTRRAAAAASDAGFAPTVIVGHSGAGAVVPAIGGALGAQRLVFVDSVLPPEEGNWEHSEVMRARLTTMADDDRMLPAWHTWWNPNMLRRLLPDVELRTAIESECRPVPLSLYDSDAVQPQGWSSPDSSVYIRLSNAYVNEATEAGERGWAVLERNGQHLDTAARPADLATLIEKSLSTTRVRVGEIGSLRRRGGVTVPRNAPGVLVVAPPDSGPFAVVNECAHQGSELLAGYVGETAGAAWIECPLHSWRFDLATGRHLVRDEPSDDPADRLATRGCGVDHNGMIWVEVPA